MEKKTSENLDVDSEDFINILDVLKEVAPTPPGSASDEPEFKALKTLLLTPPQNRRAIRGYLQQLLSVPKGDKVKKAA